MKGKKTKIKNKEIVIDASASLIGAGIGAVVGNLPGVLVGATITPVLADVLKRHLSRIEKERIEKVAEYALSEIKKQLEIGAKPTPNASDKNLKDLFEGTLLVARDSYEDRKIPLLGSIVARAPFTNTPIQNLLQALRLAEQLGYRELCILSVIGQNSLQGENALKLSSSSYHDEYQSKDDQYTIGVYTDIFSMIGRGLIAQVLLDTTNEPGILVTSVTGNIVPSNLKLLYPGLLLYNGSQLAQISKEELEPIIKSLKRASE